MNTVRTTWAALQTLAVSVGLVIAGCNSPEPTSPDAELAEVNPPRPLELKPGADRIETNSLYSLYLTEGVRNVCAGPAPFFGFGATATKKTSLPTMQTL